MGLKELTCDILVVVVTGCAVVPLILRLIELLICKDGREKLPYGSGWRSRTRFRGMTGTAKAWKSRTLKHEYTSHMRPYEAYF